MVLRTDRIAPDISSRTYPRATSTDLLLGLVH
jgi:hypothetical protein